MINIRILSMAIRTFFMANLDYAVAAGASCGGKQLLCRALCVVGPLTDGDGGVFCRGWRTLGRWPSFKEGQNVLDFGASQLARGGDWRWPRKRSTAAIHAAEGGTCTRAWTGAVNGAAETFVCTGTGTGAHVSARAGACAGRCTGTGTGVRVSARAGACAGRCTGA